MLASHSRRARSCRLYASFGNIAVRNDNAGVFDDRARSERLPERLRARADCMPNKPAETAKLLRKQMRGRGCGYLGTVTRLPCGELHLQRGLSLKEPRG